MYRALIIIGILFICLQASAQNAFIENKGQWDDNILYKIDLPDGAMFAEKNILTFNFYNPEDLKRSHAHHGDDEAKPKEFVRHHAYKLHFQDAGDPVVDASDICKDYMNYFIGNDPAKWKSNVKKYKTVKYKNLYKDIDLHLITSEDYWFKYDLIVHPGGNAEGIKMKYEGHTKLESTSDGGLKISTSLNEVKEIKPVCWQDINGKKLLVECRFWVNDPYIAFVFPAGYNPNYELFIDPVLIFSTYTGSLTDNWGFTATFDEESQVFSGGIISGTGYPASTGAFQMTQGGVWDAAIIKYTQDGVSRIFATYLGGYNCEMPQSMVVDRSGNLVVFGTTGSPDFPVTAGAYDITFNGGQSLTYDNVLTFPNGTDIYVSKLSPDGTQMIASTFIGGTGNDGMNFRNNYASFLMHGNDSLYYNYADGARGEVIVGKMDDIYVGSTTFSSDFPVTAGAFQTVFSGWQEGIVLKFNPNLTSLVWSSFFGGSKDDAIYSLDIDIMEEIYIAGGTNSVNIPTCGGTYQLISPGAGSTDGFVARISPNGSTLIKSSYFGSAAYDQVYFVRVDKTRNIYITGQTETSGTTFIYNAAYNVPNSGQFITKFPNDLSTPIWSTRFGTNVVGRPNISFTAFSVDYCNRVYLSGWGREWADSDGFTWTSIQGTKNMYVTPGSQQTFTDGQDFYLMVLADDASQIEYATFFGEQQTGSNYCGHDHVDGGTSRFDKRGNIYQSVCASCGYNCNGFPTSPNPGVWSPNNGGINSPGTWVCNNAVFKFSFEMPLTIADFTYQNVCLGQPVQFNNTSNYATNYLWDFGDASPTSTVTNPTHTYTAPGQYIVYLQASNPGSCNISDSTSKVVNVEDLSIQTQDTAVCANSSIVLNASYSGSTPPVFVWSSNSNFSDTLNSSIYVPTVTVSNSTTHTYYLHATTTYCSIVDSVTISIIPVGVTLSPDTIICNGTQGQIHAYNSFPGTLNYYWDNTSSIVSGQGTANIVVNPTQATAYSVTVTNQAGCTSTASVLVEVSNFQILSGLSENITCYGLCNGSAQVSAQGMGNISYDWSNNLHTPSVSGLCPGNYTVTVEDGVGCSDTYSALITQPPQLVATAQLLQPATCSSTNPNTGIAVVTPYGGTPDYMYMWSNQFYDSLQIDMYAGTYYITVIDANQCDTVVSVVVTDESTMQVTILPQMPSCYGYCDGSAQSVVVLPGTPPYQYNWSTGGSTDYITGLCAGTYIVTVTDSNFCFRVHGMNVDQPDPLETEIQSPGIDCFGGNTTLTAHVNSGGTSPYTYQWSTSETTQTISNVTPGTYRVTTTDNNGCLDSAEITVLEPSLMALDTNQTNVICTGVCNGQIQLFPSGGTPIYTYIWNGTPGNSIATNLCEGNYFITVTDSKGCTLTFSTQVGNNGYTPPLDATADQYNIYIGQSTTLHAQTITNIVQYDWSPGSSIQGTTMQHPHATPPQTTTYTVTVVDNWGCVNIDTVTINVLDVICDEPYVFVPNSFTPNHDGVNDVLYIYAPMASEVYFAIYNRWGEIVFSTTDVSKGWDGVFRNKEADPAVFVYYLKVTCVGKEIFEKQGNITLVR